MVNQRYIRISVRDLISPPFVRCPKCHSQYFGILSIFCDRYTRRCRECFFPTPPEPSLETHLPPVVKRLLYLDQFVVSGITKLVSNPQRPGNRPRVGFWPELSRRIHRLVRIQLLACPDSNIHEEESLVTPLFKALQLTYKRLSAGVSFHHALELKRRQLACHISAYVQGRAWDTVAVDRRDAFSSDPNCWQPRIFPIAGGSESPEWLKRLREARAGVQPAALRLFERWRREPRTFDEFFREELQVFGRAVVTGFVAYSDRMSQVANGLREFAVDDALPPPAAMFFGLARREFLKAGHSDRDASSLAVEYFASPSLAKVPFIHISSLLYAAIARKTSAGGLKSPPSNGDLNDVEMISTFMPYCDAAIIDRRMRSYLRDEPLRSEIQSSCHVFSAATAQELFAYLNAVEASASDQHLAAVEAVYGPGYLRDQ